MAAPTAIKLVRSAEGVPDIEICLIALGLGLGLAMPTLTVAIQNAVDHRDPGVATSAAIFFRSLDGAVGVALSGAIVAMRLNQARLVAAADLGVQRIAALPPSERVAVVDAYRQAIATSLLVGGIIAALGLAAVEPNH